MFWTEEKLGARLRELESYRYREGITLEEWQVTEDLEGANGAYPPVLDGDRKLRTGEHWTGYDAYLWLHRKVTVPAEWQENVLSGCSILGAPAEAITAGSNRCCTWTGSLIRGGLQPSGGIPGRRRGRPGAGAHVPLMVGTER